ncbi:MAG: tRNA (adenosine(37)-N6)-threonylcarbamoyltransferase complex ATPase subunit type 1 TsaE [Xanthomonadales bacterium]|nr:tRNA (adenosine(37)-N6)-threonylcarbamoyltransferase complex ATPase subunit type 1 TsaE [Xanthomonadales bacterium]
MKHTDLSEAALGDLATQLAASLGHEPTVIHLVGPLGAGKTTFVRSLLRALGHSGPVKSPSYGLVEPYEVGDRRICHLDLYRLNDPEELEFLGIRDLVGDTDLLLIEWPEQGGGLVPDADLTVRIDLASAGHRDVELLTSATRTSKTKVI